MSRKRLFAVLIVCLTAALCFSCGGSSDKNTNTPGSAIDGTDSDPGDNTDSNDDANDDADTDPGSDATSRILLTSHISGGGSARSSNYSANFSVGGPAAGKASSTNYGITLGTGAVINRK